MKWFSFLIHEKPIIPLSFIFVGLCFFSVFLGSSLLIFVSGFAGLLFGRYLNVYLKNFFKSQRPRNTSRTQDYSFPSFHAQTTSFLVGFFFLHSPLTLLLTVPVFLVAVLHRLVGRHHYFNDIFGGVVIGLLSGLFFGLF